ncbi:MAG: CCA tRNA nucleotidyltransferase [Deltaproteobacteria bacterium]|nr:CCA tRNA nucleotidyltransferase [Deltaproteobacteria bacterium]
MQLAVPEPVREVCRVLAQAGHEAVTVGGAVRDALLGRPVSDWDVATSAHPEEVVKLFKKTIPTGLQHGTVTVVVQREHVEVTTFRGEGAYSDARRPDSVTFGVPLVEDLARRDLTVNAIAYDPEKQQLVDPFGGQRDIEARLLRAVGDPVARFTEDGLRVMRAVRFCAQLEFELEPATEAGIVAALPSLARVSRERVHDELVKLLSARQPSRGLVPAVRTGIIASVLPALGRVDAERVDRAARRVRLAALLAPLSDDETLPHVLDRPLQKRVAEILRALKFSNEDIDQASTLVAVSHAPRAAAWEPAEVRRLLSQLARDHREPAIELWESAAEPNHVLVQTAQRVLGDPLATGDLAVTGKDLMDALQMKPGPAIGRMLAMLLQRVIDDPSRNTRETLLAEAQTLELEVGR